VVEAKGAVGGGVLVTVVGLPGAVTAEVWGVVAGVVSVVVGGSGVEDGAGCVEGSGSGGVLLCTGVEEGGGGVEEDDSGVELGGGAEEEEGGSALLDGAEVESGAIENGKKTWSVNVRQNEQIEDQK